MDFFGHVATWLDKKDEVNFKFYDVTAQKQPSRGRKRFLKIYTKFTEEHPCQIVNIHATFSELHFGMGVLL